MTEKNKQPCVMVCVTPQKSSARLIEAGARIAKEEKLPLVVISVFRENVLTEKTGEIIEELYSCAHKCDAGMDIYFNNDPGLVVAVVAKKENASTLVTGFPAQGSSGFIAGIHELLPDLPITMVDENSNEYKILPVKKQKVRFVSPIGTSVH